MPQFKKIYGTLLILLFIISSCQNTLVKKQSTGVIVDSTQYFSDVQVNDPFLDKLASNPSQSFVLKKTLIPPPIPEPEKPKFKTIEGYRVQIFAGVDSINALASKALAKSTVTDTIYRLNEKGLYKLQVGDYPYYPQADSIKRKFRQTKFSGAWIVKTNIFIPIKEIELDSTIDSTSEKSTGTFKIQVIATADEIKAQTIVNKLKIQFSGKALYEKNGNIFKVFVGYFDKEEEARNALNIIREGEFPDAWLVY